jgi:thiamine biosynthesis lipoprotein
LQQSLVIDGRRYSHIVDPRTGVAVQHAALVTVISPNATEADALATAFSVLDPHEAIQIAQKNCKVAVRIVFREGDAESRLKTIETPDFADFIR